MAYNNFDLKLDKFNSKIKFYFSLMFMSKIDFLTMKEYFGKNINIFDYAEEDLEEKDIELLSTIIENVIWNNNSINLSDEEITRLFINKELIEYHSEYILGNTLDVNDPENIEDFLCFSMLKKVEEKKEFEKSTLYEYLDTCTKEEIHRAISNLNGYDHEQFTMYFGINYDKECDFNTNDRIKNDLLIKIYSYILKNREDNDVPMLLTMVSKDLIKDYDLFDFIRRLCDDNSLSNDSILKIVSKLDYDSKLNLKLTYGKDYKEKKKAPQDEAFKKAIMKLVKEVKKAEKKKKPVKKAKGIGPQPPKKKKEQETKNQNKKIEKEKINVEKSKEKVTKEKINKEKNIEIKNKKIKIVNVKKVKKENSKKPKEEIKNPKDKKEVKIKVVKEQKKPIKVKADKEKKKIPLVKVDKKKQEAKKIEIKKPKKEVPKVEVKKEKEEVPKTKIKVEEDKKSRLKKFLSKYNLDKKDFLIAVSMLGALSKSIVEYYFGIKKDPIDIDEIAIILSEDKKNVEKLLDEACKKIDYLIKSGQVDKKKIVVPAAKVFVKDDILNQYVTEKNISMDLIKKAALKLAPLTAAIVMKTLGADGRSKSNSEVAKELGISEKSVDNIRNMGAYQMIDELSKLEKEDKKEKEKLQEEEKKSEKVEPKVEIPKKIVVKKEEIKKVVEEKKLNNKKIAKASSLNEFLSASGLTKDEFNYGYKALDSLSKRLISLYFSAYTIDQIAKDCNMNSNDVEMLINQAKNAIIVKSNELKKGQNNTTLKDFLRQNNISLVDFNKNFKKLTPLEQSVLSLYLGLNSAPLSPEQIARKLYRSEGAINSIIKSATSDLKNLSKATTKQNIGRLQLFLKENGMSLNDFNNALRGLSKNKISVLSMYFGLNGKEYQISEIASLTGMNKVAVVNMITSAKNDILNIVRLNKNNKKQNSKDDILLNKYKEAEKILMTNPELIEMIKINNPIGYQCISILSRYSINPQELGSVLKVPNNIAIGSLMSIIDMAQNYDNGKKKNPSSSFQDNEDNIKKDKNRSR